MIRAIAPVVAVRAGGHGQGAVDGFEDRRHRGRRRRLREFVTAVNALVREYLTELAGREEEIANARRELLDLMETSEGRMGPDWKFSREDSHER